MFRIHNKGFALPSAMFLLVILASLAIGLFAVIGYSQKAVIDDVLDVKATMASKAVLDYGIYQVTKNGICSSANQTISFTENYFVGFKVTYSCNSVSADEAGITTNYYTITANACNTVGASCPEAIGKPTTENYVEKSLTALVSQ